MVSIDRPVSHPLFWMRELHTPALRHAPTDRFELRDIQPRACEVENVALLDLYVDLIRLAEAPRQRSVERVRVAASISTSAGRSACQAASISRCWARILREGGLRDRRRRNRRSDGLQLAHDESRRRSPPTFLDDARSASGRLPHSGQRSLRRRCDDDQQDVAHPQAVTTLRPTWTK